jgi:hypothetical protein
MEPDASELEEFLVGGRVTITSWNVLGSVKPSKNPVVAVVGQQVIERG